MIPENMLIELLSQEESEHLDFKCQYKESINEHLHDILCLLNSPSTSDRYIIFGVQNKTNVIVGIENDAYRKKWQEDKFQDWFRKIRFNRRPDIRFMEIKFKDHYLGIIKIKNRHDKPFFLLEGVGRARSGVIYTRNGSTNTPHNECASDADIENMWRERFGINLGSLSRLSRLMDDSKKWAITDDGATIHHIDYPEFHIKDLGSIQDFHSENGYRKKIKIPSESKHDYIHTYNIFYFSTHIADATLILFDEGRSIMPSFEVKFSSDQFGDDNFKLFVTKESLNYKFYKIYLELKNTSNTFRKFEYFQNSYRDEPEMFIFYPI